MTRGAILTLGVIVPLTGFSAVWADDASLFGFPALTAVPASATGVFPHMPENWSDLPLQLKISESFGFNSNIANTPANATAASGLNSLVFGHPIGAFESISSYGFAFKNNIFSGSTLFADGSWGLNRYLANAFFNTEQHNVDAGVNFNYGSKCSGQLKGSDATALSTPGQQIGFNVINTVTTVAFNETLNCLINGEYSAQLNSGYTDTTNSAVQDQLNNSRSIFVSAGITYTVSDTNSLQALATITGTKYPAQQTSLQSLASSQNTPLTAQQLAVLSQGLASNLTEDQVSLIYTKQFGPNISLNAQFGLVGVRDEYFSIAVPRSILPDYSLSLHWTATPKLAFNLAVSKTVTPPTSVVSNLQINENATLGFAYQITPKISVSGNVAAGRNSGAFTSAVVNRTLQNFTSAQTTYNVGLGLSYAMTPFLNASLAYSYWRSVQAGLSTPTSTIFLALNFSPY